MNVMVGNFYVWYKEMENQNRRECIFTKCYQNSNSEQFQFYIV